MKSMFVLPIVVLLILFLGCKNQEKETVKFNLKKMSSIKIKIPYNEFERIESPCCDESEYPYDSALLKLIIYSDSSECNLCMMRKLYEWNRYVRLEERYSGKFVLRFIIYPPERLLNEIRRLYLVSDLHAPIYIDLNGAFLRNNSMLPKDSKYHTFLLDECDSVILVGNPLHNHDVETLMFGIIDERLRLKHRVNKYVNNIEQ
jgi:hypothetical protein